jgi:NAD(P)-dependent dehydrogenase (short-subunit alcohol dehydrogenase family)
MIAQGFGRVINISGLDAFWGTAQKIHVGTANFGLIGFSRGLAVEYADQGITVNTVVPGVFGSAVPHEGDGSAGRNLEELAKRLPAGRMGRPEEIAAVCRFLAQEDASFVTGQTIHVNGGAYPTRGSA